MNYMNRKARLSRPGWFLLFLICGLVALGPLQWTVPHDPVYRAIYKIGIPLIFLIITIFLYRSERFNQCWQVFFAFFVGSFAFFIAWLGAYFLNIQPTTMEGFALAKLSDALLIIIPIIVLTRIAGGDMASLYLKKGNLKLGLLVGLLGFAGFVAISIDSATDLFYGTDLGVWRIISWTPWILAFVLANGALEELLYRGLFLKKLEPFMCPNSSNLLLALIFTIAHLGVTYTSDSSTFFVILLILGLAWGYIIQRTDSLLAAILFHAGADVVLVIGLFSNL